MTSANPSLEIPDPTFEPGWDQDSTSRREATVWPTYDELNKAKHKNTLLVHRTIGYIIPVALILAFVAFAGLTGVYLWHLIAPEHCRWLKADELQNIHSIVFSSVVGGAIAILAKTYFAEPKKED